MRHNAPHLVVSNYNEPLKWVTDWKGNVTICTHASNNTVCNVPINKGAEASAYLLFILLHWANLPRIMVFVDSHRTSWHQPHNKLNCAQTIISSHRFTGYGSINNIKIDTLNNPTWDGATN